MHHNQTVSVGDGVLHIMCDHHRCKTVICNDLIGNVKHLLGCFRVKGRRMLIPGAEASASGADAISRVIALALTAGKQPDFCGHPGFQPQIQCL